MKLKYHKQYKSDGGIQSLWFCIASTSWAGPSTFQPSWSHLSLSAKLVSGTVPSQPHLAPFPGPCNGSGLGMRLSPTLHAFLFTLLSTVCTTN